ncbi:MAG: multicopper oxidase domain-containing protein [Wenzhouxiangellaceae bacterium]|nr:multicopper oxidase domain-containing protein [Wenzhouxiangellaceae bacterium]
MPKRRDVLKLGAVAGGLGLTASQASARGSVPESGLVFPQGFTPSIFEQPSPPSTPFKDPLYRMPTASPIPAQVLNPRPDGRRHQRFYDFPPVNFYREVIEERRWIYHSDPPYNQGSWSYTMNGSIPGPTYKGFYGEAAFVRRVNNLPSVGQGKVPFALPSTTMHLHNGHTASESDGIPTDFMNPGEFWDHHYANYPAGGDEREIMNTLWYHDHRLDFTAPNVYAGLSGFYLLFDEKDSDNENDPNPAAFRMPSGEYDIPLMFHDVQFGADGQAIFDFFAAGEAPTPVPKTTSDKYPESAHKGSNNFTLFGMLGDKITVNRIIQPFLTVEARKYRFRMLNGGPSRFYDFWLRLERADGTVIDNHPGLKFYIMSNDGNLLPEPIVQEHIEIWVANRFDVIVDFSAFEPGDKVYLVNRMDMRRDGAGPTGKLLDEGELAMRFDVVPLVGEDPSRIPDFMRELPDINMSEVRRERLWVFDYDNGLWTVNGKLMDANRIDANIEQGSAEIWTIRNAGNSWAHPIHTHFEEFQILEVDGRPVKDGDLLRARKDLVELGPNMEIKFFGRWRDFLGTHVMHCHNVVHEDHEMMIQWRIVPPGQGD